MVENPNPGPEDKKKPTRPTFNFRRKKETVDNIAKIATASAKAAAQEIAATMRPETPTKNES